jgi:hypothetical protein
MRYSINIDHEHRVINYTHDGSISLAQLEEAWDQLLGCKEFTEQSFNLLSDYRGGKLILSKENLKFVNDFLRSVRVILEGKKQAVVVDDPVSTAISILFEEKMLLDIKFKVKTFSTMEAALKWLVQ